MEKFITAQFFIKPECVDAFKAETVDLIKKTREEDGCISYNLYQSIENSTDFIFYENFKNQESINAHASSEHFKKFEKAFATLVSKDPIIAIRS